jgi:hypothetical protein
MEKIPRGASQFMLWIRNVARMEEIKTGTKCVRNTERKGLIGRPGADWRILLNPLGEIHCYMELGFSGGILCIWRWAFFRVHTVHETF